MSDTNDSGNDALGESVTHLLHRAGQIADECLRAELERLKVTPRQFALLTAIDARPGSTQIELVADTGIDKSTIAEMTRRLVVPGLIEKSLRDGDVRATSLRLTSAGRRLLKQCRSAAEVAETRFLSRLPPSRQKSLVNGLKAAVTGPKNRARGGAKPGDPPDEDPGDVTQTD